MKNLYKYVFMGILAIGLGSCDDDEENVTVVVQDTVETGAVLRTIEIISNELPIGEDDALFSAIIEEQDEQEGALLSSVDVFLTYSDLTPDDGDSTGGITDEVSLFNIPASDFTPGPFGLPRTTVTVTLQQMLSSTNLSADQIFGGDIFSVRLALNLTDGRVFSSNNAGGIITGGFFNSPFQYTNQVVCPVPSDYFIGEYLMERISTQEDPFFPNYGPAFDTQLVTVSGEGATREFGFSYFPEGFDFPQLMTLTLSCNNFLVSGTAASGTLGCGDGSIGQSNGAIPPSNYDTSDDTVLEIAFEDFNPDAGCGTGSYPVTIRMTKQ